MNTVQPGSLRRSLTLGFLLLLSALVISSLLLPDLRQRLLTQLTELVATKGATPPQSADKHDHGEATHNEPTGPIDSVDLSASAMKNLGLDSQTLLTIGRTTFFRSVTIPAVVVERPGRTRLHISAPLTGVVTQIHVLPGEAVVPGTVLFEIRLTHEELVTAQTQFLQTLGELEVEAREIARLEAVAETGALSARTLLERRYARDRLQALLRAQAEALRLHGLTDEQVDGIATERRLLSSLQVVAPSLQDHSHGSPQTIEDKPSIDKQVLVLEHLEVDKGQAVEAGTPLGTLTCPEDLLIEGHAFAEDRALLSQAAEAGWSPAAIFPGRSNEERLGKLQIQRIGLEVDPVTRILPFYLELANPRVRDELNSAGQRIVEWKYLQGERLELLVPAEKWTDQIVLPAAAVVRDGTDWLVFRRNGRLFERVAVHVLHADNRDVVIADDGCLFPGDVVAGRSAAQLLMALRGQTAPVDPHAGHTH